MARLEIPNPATGHDVIEFDKALAGSPKTQEALRVFTEKVGVETMLAVTRNENDRDSTVAKTFDQTKEVTRFKTRLGGG